MRVALRRLRSALALFRRAVVRAPSSTSRRPALRVLAHALGPARDWDVFGTGTGEAVAAAFPADAAVTRLTAAAARRRDACYAELRHVLDGAAFRRLGITLARARGRPAVGSAPAPPTRPAPNAPRDARRTSPPARSRAGSGI